MNNTLAHWFRRQRRWFCAQLNCLCLWLAFDVGPLNGRRARSPTDRKRFQIVCALTLWCPGILWAVMVVNWKRSRVCISRILRSWRGVIAWRWPGRGRSSVDPVVVNQFHNLAIVVRCTPNLHATSVWDSPTTSIPIARSLSFLESLGISASRHKVAKTAFFKPKTYF